MIILYQYTVRDLGKCKNQLVVIAMKHMADKSKFSDGLSVISDLSAHYTANRSTCTDRHNVDKNRIREMVGNYSYRFIGRILATLIHC